MDKYDKIELAKKVGYGLMTIAVGLSSFAVGGLTVEPEVITHNVTVPSEPQIVEVPKIVERNVTVEKVVEVENTSKIDYMSQRLVDMEIVDEDFEPIEVFMAEDAAKEVAMLHIEDELADVLDDEGIIRDEDKFDIIRVYDDYEDIEVLRSDFEDSDYRFNIEYKVEDERRDSKFKVKVTVDVEDGEPEIRNVEKL